MDPFDRGAAVLYPTDEDIDIAVARSREPPTCTRWSRSERSSICGMSGEDRQARRAGRAVP
jgi:hypothetical protein